MSRSPGIWKQLCWSFHFPFNLTTGNSGWHNASSLILSNGHFNKKWIEVNLFLFLFRSCRSHKPSSKTWSTITEQECFRCCCHRNTTSKDYREQGCASTCYFPHISHSASLRCCSETQNCKEQIEETSICYWWCRLSNQWNVLVINNNSIILLIYEVIFLNGTVQLWNWSPDRPKDNLLLC